MCDFAVGNAPWEEAWMEGGVECSIKIILGKICEALLVLAFLSVVVISFLEKSSTARGSRRSRTAPEKWSALESLPLDLLALIFSFHPPFFVVRNATCLSSRVAQVLLNSGCWRNQFEFDSQSFLFRQFRTLYPSAPIETLRIGCGWNGIREGKNRDFYERLVPKNIKLNKLLYCPSSMRWLSNLPLKSLTILDCDVLTSLAFGHLKLEKMHSLRTAVLPWWLVSDLRGLPVTDLSLIGFEQEQEWSWTRISGADLGVVASLPLTRLKISGSLGRQACKELKNLRLLELKTEKDLLSSLQELTKDLLHTLQIERAVENWKELERLRDFPALTELSCVLYTNPKSVFEGMKLTTLSLCIHNENQLQNLGSVPTLSRLKLWADCPSVLLSNKAWSWVSAAFPKLDKLEVSIEVQSWNFIHLVKDLTCLNCDVSKRLQPLSKLPRLRHLTFAASHYRVKQFRSLAGCPRLRTLTLVDPQFPVHLVDFLSPSVEIFVWCSLFPSVYLLFPLPALLSARRYGGKRTMDECESEVYADLSICHMFSSLCLRLLLCSFPLSPFSIATWLLGEVRWIQALCSQSLEDTFSSLP